MVHFYIRHPVPRFSLLCVTFLIISTPAWACECFIAQPPAIDMVRHDAVFEGEVTGISTPDDLIGDGRISFRVNRSWKGVTTTTVEILTASSPKACGYHFNIGGRYVVYASGPAGSLHASSCSRTADILIAKEDLAFLSKVPELPLKRSSHPQMAEVFAALAVVAAAWAVYRGGSKRSA